MSDSEVSAEKSALPSRIILIGVALVVIVTLVLVWNQANPNAYTTAEETLHAGTAKTLTGLGKLEEAEQVYTELLEHSRSEAQFGSYYFQRGNLRYRQERYEEAIQDYEQAAVHDPEGFIYQARWNLAQAYARLGDKARAAQELKAFQDEYGEELPQFNNLANNALLLLEK